MTRLRTLFAALALALLVAAPVAAKQSSTFDVCPNLPGWQDRVPGGYVAVIYPDGSWACVPR